MTKRWKLRYSSFNILLVLVTLVPLAVDCTPTRRHSPPVTNVSHAAPMADSNLLQTHIYVGNDQIARYFFGPSTRDDASSILEGLVSCLDSFHFFTCFKMLLLSRMNDVMPVLEDPRDFQLLHGLLTFKVNNATENSLPEGTTDHFNLDEEIADKMHKIFRRRSLSVNFPPKTHIRVEPSGNAKDNFLCFRYALRQDEEQSPGDGAVEGRKKSKGGMPTMMMIVPPLIMLGLMPFTLASLKAMVMNAVMINMMALNGAIFMTIRNLVFGPRRGDNVKYVNYGYSKDRQTQSRRPVLIIHSPAAFVKQPPVHKNPSPQHSSSHHHHHHHHHHRHHFLQEDHRDHSGGNPAHRKRTTESGHF